MRYQNFSVKFSISWYLIVPRYQEVPNLEEKVIPHGISSRTVKLIF